MSSAQLWIGSQNILKAQALARVQREYCVSSGCKSCSICKQIENQQFHAFLIISTIKSTYSRSDLDTIFSKIAIARAQHEPFFCVITQAEKLSDSCANSLLKLLEEPPFGWHWLLLTDRPQELLPTVKSRCVVTEFACDAQDSEYREMLTLFTQKKLADIIQFHQIIDRIKISDYESRLLLDDMITFWTQESLKNGAYFSVVTYLHGCLEKLPMPGSGKIFWRNVYLNLSCLLN
jgi:DNA polymerase-3 subunit delta'